MSAAKSTERSAADGKPAVGSAPYALAAATRASFTQMRAFMRRTDVSKRGTKCSKGKLRKLLLRWEISFDHHASAASNEDRRWLETSRFLIARECLSARQPCCRRGQGSQFSLRICGDVRFAKWQPTLPCFACFVLFARNLSVFLLTARYLPMQSAAIVFAIRLLDLPTQRAHSTAEQRMTRVTGGCN